MFWLWFKRMKNSISSYSLPLCLSHGTRRTNLSPQDQAKYKLSSDQAQVHVSSPSLCVLESPFTGFSSSTTPTSSKKTKSNSHQHDKKKKIIWSNMYHKKINPKSNSHILKNLLLLAIGHTCIISSKFSFMTPHYNGRFSLILPIFPYICKLFRLSVYRMATIDI